jgi:hypothetical protein
MDGTTVARFITHHFKPLKCGLDRFLLLQRLLEYAYIMTRAPELQKVIEEKTNVPEHAQAELDQLLKSVPTLLEKLPLVLPRPDPGHKAALAEIVTQLMNLVRPTVLVRQFSLSIPH